MSIDENEYMSEPFHHHFFRTLHLELPTMKLIRPRNFQPNYQVLLDIFLLLRNNLITTNPEPRSLKVFSLSYYLDVQLLPSADQLVILPVDETTNVVLHRNVISVPGVVVVVACPQASTVVLVVPSNVD